MKPEIATIIGAWILVLSIAAVMFSYMAYMEHKWKKEGRTKNE